MSQRHAAIRGGEAARGRRTARVVLADVVGAALAAVGAAPGALGDARVRGVSDHHAGEAIRVTDLALGGALVVGRARANLLADPGDADAGAGAVRRGVAGLHLE